MYSFVFFAGVTTVLSITTIGFGGRSQLPKTNYATSLDWFIILCFSYVFAVMIEYAVINFIDKVTQDIKIILSKRKKSKDERMKEKKEMENPEADVENEKVSKSPMSWEDRRQFCIKDIFCYIPRSKERMLYSHLA